MTKTDKHRASDETDEQVTTFADGWELRISRRSGEGITALLTNGHDTWSLSRDETIVFDLATYGYVPRLSFDNAQHPTVIWSKEDGGSPFVWFCGLDVADWSHPL